MPRGNICIAVTAAAAISLCNFASAAENSERPNTADRPTHQESARQHEDASPPNTADSPALPEGMTLDEVLDRAASPPPESYPEPVPDDRMYAFLLFEQLEYRFADDATRDHLGWEAQGWIGGNFNKFWLKNEGKAVFEGADEGETETDLLYSRLITPFWNFQLGAQYAYEWARNDYEDRWSGVIALQGLAPYKFELDNSLYISEDADVTLEIEGEYDVRITQRLVLQPRTELGFAAQDVSERGLGAGMTDGIVDLRLRYEVKREFVPYIGVRYQFLVGETDNLAEAAGEDTEQVFFVAGLRCAF